MRAQDLPDSVQTELLTTELVHAEPFPLDDDQEDIRLLDELDMQEQDGRHFSRSW